MVDAGYDALIEAAIDRERDIIGDDAIDRARDVDGLDVDDGVVTGLDRDGKAMLGDLVDAYVAASGDVAAFLIARRIENAPTATSNCRRTSLPTSERPPLLRDSWPLHVARADGLHRGIGPLYGTPGGTGRGRPVDDS